MGARLGFGLKRPGPASNAYALRLAPGSPAYTMGARVGFNLKPRSPGPAVYFQRDADVYKTKSVRLMAIAPSGSLLPFSHPVDLPARRRSGFAREPSPGRSLRSIGSGPSGYFFNSYTLRIIYSHIGRCTYREREIRVSRKCERRGNRWRNENVG